MMAPGSGSNPEHGERAWEGGAISLAAAGAALAVCNGEGQVLDASPSARRLLARVGCLPETEASRLPRGLWETVCKQPPGEEVHWRPRDAELCLSCARHGLGSSLHLLYLADASNQQQFLTLRLHHQRREALQSIAASVAHELRAPLSSIVFNIEVLKRQWAQLSAREVVSLLEEVSLSCEQQDRCIRALIDAAKLWPARAVSLREVFERVSGVVHPIYRDGSHTLVCEVDPAHDVRGNPLLIEHIFINILVNAAEASRRPVTVKVLSERVDDLPDSISRAEMPLEGQPRGFVRARISDDGPGIAPEVRPRLFDPFFSTKEGGSGIGLTLARQTARELGGDIFVLDSERGACFEVRLPAVTPPERGLS